MLEKLSLQLTSLICTESYNNPQDRAKIQYGLSILLSEGFKIISLILFFHIIHYQNFFYFSLCILMTIRIFAGGLHVKGTLNCLLLTIILFLFTSVLSPLMPRINIIYYLSISIFSLILLLSRAPVCSTVRPIKDNKKKLQYKFTAAFITTVWSIILLSSVSPSYENCGFSTILLQNIQLVLVKKPKS